MLSERDRSVLAFEASWWHYPEPKDRAIRDYLGMSATRYYQILRRLADDEDALAADPMTVRRLRRVRTRAAQRVAEQLGGQDPGA